MIIAVIAVGVMQPPIHEIVDMIAVGNGFMPAARSVGVAGATDVWGALRRIVSTNSQHMFVDMIFVHVVQVPVMQVIPMPLVANRDVSARPFRLSAVSRRKPTSCKGISGPS